MNPRQFNKAVCLRIHMQSPKPDASPGFMSITIESFTLKAGSFIAEAANVTDLFVEYSFLNFEYGELETPSSLPKPLPGESANYNFRKGTPCACIISAIPS